MHRDGLVNGVNTAYTLKHPIHTVFSFEINGEDIDSSQYTVANSATASVITFTTPLPASLANLPFEMVYD